MHDLNDQQRQAVRHLDTPLLVLAGAGSGKTRVITEKIVHLVEDRGMPARNIFAVTFTNKAAREMQERVSRRLEKDRRRGLNVSTFHTLGLNLIRRETAAMGLRPGFTVLDAEDSLAMLKSLLAQGEVSNAIEPKAARWQISLWKNDLLSPESAFDRAEDEEERAVASLYSQYERQLRACNALDFDDLIGRPIALLRDNAEIRERWQNRVRYLLVDEYQDTNTAQYELVRLLVGPLANLTAVGDDHQSIYAWRGARPENLMRLKEDFPRLTVVKLEQNYRSVNTVLSAANHLIANDTTTLEKRLWSEVGPGDPHRVIVADTADDEADRIATEILHHKFRQNTRYRDYAVLFRGNHQARLIEQALRKLNIPYSLTGGQSFFERAEIKDAMAYLRLLANPDDDAALLRVINTPRREIGPTTLERLGSWAAQRRCSMHQAATSAGIHSVLDERAVHRLQRFTDWLGQKRLVVRHEDAVTALRQLFEQIDYVGYLRDQSPSAKAAERRWQNVTDWFEWLDRLGKDEDGSQALDLDGLVQKMSLMGILEQQTKDRDDDAVALLTLHAAKGLEYPHVFLCGMEEELLPHRDCCDDDRLHEERRLCFVGITRAQRSLTFTLTRRRRRFGEWRDSLPSRFLEEIPEELLSWSGVGIEQPEEVTKAQGRAHLADIRAMLNQAK